MSRVASSRSAIHSTALALGMAIFAALNAPFAHADTPDLWDGNLHGSITPYGWLPGVTAQTRFQLPNNGGSVDTKSDNNILDHLSGAFMLEGVVHQDNWGAYADVDWVNFTDQNGHFTSIGGDRIGANADLNTRWGMKGGMVNLAGLYTLAHGQQGFIDLVFGARYLWMKGNLNWNFSLTGNAEHLDIEDSGHLHNQTHVTDAIVGVRGRWAPFSNSNFFFPYYLDIGTGDSDNTYQAVVGVAYAFHWGDIALNYRDVEYKEGSDNMLIKKLQLSGPAFSLTWNF
jgi:hypothetical protein